MNVLPITLTLFSSTKGHWGSRELYRYTLKHLDRECPLSLFGTRLAHIKVTPGEDNIAAEMEGYLKGLGFDVIKTVAAWKRGAEHQTAYLLDQNLVSQNPILHSQKFMLMLEDDSPFVAHKRPLADLLSQACQILDQDYELVSLRTLRRGDLSSSPMVDGPKDSRWFWSPHYNFQPAILRTRDWYLVHRMIESNWARVSHLQSELLLRLAFEQFSRRSYKHIVYWPDEAETFHIGVPDWAEQLKKLNL